MAPTTVITPRPRLMSMAQHVAARPLTAYFALAFALTWALVLPMTLSVNLGFGLLPYALPDPVGLTLFVLASFVGPTVAALIVAGLSERRAGVAALLRPVVRWRVGMHWYAVALLANLLIWLLAYGVTALLLVALTHGRLGAEPRAA